MSSFASFGLLPSLESTLTRLQLTAPTEIQARAIPELLAGRSVVGVAETGSGKTLAYALPVLHLLKSLEADGAPVEAPSAPRALIVVPNRELGEQVARVFKMFTHDTRLRVRTVLGGVQSMVNRENVKGPFEVLVATPGRLVQLLDTDRVSLADVRLMIMDEADQLLDQGFLPLAGRIVGACPATRQLALFSATVSPQVEALIKRLFSEPIVIKSRGSHHVVASLTTDNRAVVRGRRFDLLRTVLGEPGAGGTLIFTNTREQCDTVTAELTAAGWRCGMYRGEMDRLQRRANLKAFRAGELELLITTDLGSRGLDIDHVARVINYHLPQSMENYLHRVGRTARAGREGRVVNFVTERDQELVRRLDGIRAPSGGKKP